MKINQESYRNRLEGGFSMASTMGVLMVVAIITGVAFHAITGAVETVEEHKLETDIAKLNGAIQVYEANGGNFDLANTPQAVIDKLKAAAAVSERKRFVGFGGATVDSGLVALMQSAAEAATDQARATWDAAKRRFVVSRSGTAGIKALEILPIAEPVATGARDTSLKYSANSSWVWDYQDRENSDPSVPANRPIQLNPNLAGSPNNPYAYPLGQPLLSLPGGSYPLGSYDIPITLTNPNPPDLSTLFYSVEVGVWETYEGGIVPVAPGQTLVAYAKSNDPDAWEDSAEVQATYETDAVTPDLDLYVPAAAVTYAEVGGAMIGGGIGAVAPVLASLVNSSEIPARYQSDSVFSIHWTYDGSDPLTSPTRVDGSPFSGGFPGQEVPYDLANWGSGSSLPIKLAAESHNGQIVNDSEIVGVNLSIATTALRAPAISPIVAGGGTQPVTIDLVTEFGDMPEGARIYYTTDGTDPGADSGGYPISGTLYTGQFGLDVAVDTEINARVYAPGDYTQWFTPSPLHTVSARQPVIGFTMAVSTAPPAQ